MRRASHWGVGCALPPGEEGSSWLQRISRHRVDLVIRSPHPNGGTKR
jgi:hypothetical protein